MQPAIDRWRWVIGLLERIEERSGKLTAGLVLGLALLLLGAIYVTPALRLMANGVFYGQMAADPFNFTDGNPFRHRILSSAVAHFLFLRGEKFLFFPLIAAVLFLGLIYWHFRNRGAGIRESVLAASLMAFSTPILLVLHFAGYTDTISYALLFLCLAYRTRRSIWAPAFALAALNHEANLLSAPWVLFWVASARWGLGPGAHATGKPGASRWLQSALDLALILSVAGLYLLFLNHVAAWSDFRSFNGISWAGIVKNFQMTVRYAWLGVFLSFKLFWVLPLIVVAHTRARERRFYAMVFFLMFMAGACQLLLASDTSRHFGHAFPAILLSTYVIARKRIMGDRFEPWLSTLILLNFLVPEYYVGQWMALPFLPLPLSLLLMIFGIDPWKYPIPWGW